MKSTEERERRRNQHHGSHSLSSSGERNPSFLRSRNPSCFYKLMLFPTTQSKKLRIPELFSRAFSEELPGTAILTVPTGESWEVALIKEGNNLWFREGWQDFVEYFSIAFAYFLLFLYQGNSKFEVHIFSPTACEISYPCNARNKFPAEKPMRKDDSNDVGVVSFGTWSAPNDSDVEVTTLDSGDEDPSLNGHEEPMRRDDDVVSDGFTGNFSSSDDDMELGPDEGSMHSSETNDENQVTQSVDDENQGTQSEELMEALASVGISMLKNPFFAILVKKYNIYRGCFVRVPTDFAREYLTCKARKHMKLEASDGKQWKVRCVVVHNSFNLGSGWIVFARENRLQVGDVCAFELSDAQNSVLKVHVGIKSQLTKQNKWIELLKRRA